MDDHRAKFQQLLRELFQFDCADLHFGIYRIMNHKRDVIERFITQDLPKAITEEDDASGQQAMKFDDYLLKYMLKWETRASETLLNVEKLARPFSYKLHIHADGQTREKVVDILETFNYLLGLHVRTRRVHDDDGRRYLVYTGRLGHRLVVVIWRETEGWQKADLERDKKFVAEQKLTEGADEVFVNGDSFIPKAKALEPVFKARMFAGVES